MSTGKFSFSRREYRYSILDEKDADPDPFVQFRKWMQDAISSGISESEAMFLSTAGKDGVPSGRIVLLKDISRGGFVFFTNYNSRKGKQIEENPFASATFFWKELERQVRITGNVEKTTDEESDAYFLSRPEESRTAAAVSPQSMVIPDRKYLEDLYMTGMELNKKRPPHWGGFRIMPFEIEFWQGREFRLHDRIRYRSENDTWIIERLAP